MMYDVHVCIYTYTYTYTDTHTVYFLGLDECIQLDAVLHNEILFRRRVMENLIVTLSMQS